MPKELAAGMLGLVAVAGAYVGLLWHPEPCFAYHVQAGRLALSSDRPFPPEAGRAVLAEARGRLAATPFFDPDRPLRAFICNDPARYRFFFNRSAGAAGVCPVPIPAVFLRAADVEANRMLDRQGTPVAPPRDLAYYVAHELSHDLCGAHYGVPRYYAAPRWVREGVADYVARKGTFTLSALLAARRAGAPEMDPASGRYDRFMLYVAWCVERKGLGIDQLFGAAPSEARLERELCRGVEKPTADLCRAVQGRPAGGGRQER